MNLKPVFGVLVLLLGLGAFGMLVSNGFFNPSLKANYTFWEHSWTRDDTQFQFYVDFPPGQSFVVELPNGMVFPTDNLIEGAPIDETSRPTYQDRIRLIEDFRLEETYGPIDDWSWSLNGNAIALITRPNHSEQLTIVDASTGDLLYSANRQHLLTLTHSKNLSIELEPLTVALFSVILILFGGALIVSGLTDIRKVLVTLILMGASVCCYVISVIIYVLLSTPS